MEDRAITGARGMGPAERAARLLGGVVTGAFAFSIVFRAHLGLGPWHVLQDGLSQHLGIPIGSATWAMNFGLLLVALLVRERPGIGTLVGVGLGGATIDAILPHIDTPDALWLRLAMLVLGTVIMSLGGALMISAAVGVAPLDAVMTGVYKRSPVRIPLFGVRIGLEVIGLTLGWLAGGEVGIGSLLIGAGIGPGIHTWLHVLRAMPQRHEDEVLTDPTAVY